MEQKNYIYYLNGNMFHMEPANHGPNYSKTGILGEELAVKYLKQLNYTILQQNYQKKFGEIDVIAEKEQMVHFIEVKTVSYETKANLEDAVSYETWRPEELVHKRKLHKLRMVAEAWINEHSYTGNVQIGVIGVRIVPRETFCTINYIENVI